MIFIKKRSEPRALSDARRVLRQTPDVVCNYDNLPPRTRRDIVGSLVAEQGEICAYCMRRISVQDARIEHYLVIHPSDTYRRQLSGSGVRADYDADAKSLDYRNMLAVCDGGSDSGQPDRTCDAARNAGRNKDVPLKVDPLNPGSIAQVRYRNDGTVWSEDPDINRDLDKLLNLNSRAFSLKENRRSALVSLQKKIEGHCRAHGPQSKRNWCAKMYGRISNATTKSEYVGILLWQLKRWMK